MVDTHASSQNVDRSNVCAVTLKQIDPMWERWTPDPDAPRDRRLRGGHRWRLAVPAGQKKTMRAGYEVKIANKHELVGGNRRES